LISFNSSPMLSAKADIIAQLRRDLLSLQGFKPASAQSDVGLSAIASAFPNHAFPTGAIHEFISDNLQDHSATCGFISALLAPLMKTGAATVWIAARPIFPHGLLPFDISPEQVLFVGAHKDRDRLWAAEEALKCNGLAAVIFDIADIDFTESRRLQLAVEKSKVTGFFLRHRPRSQNPLATIARWRIKSIASELPNGIPGLGFPRWEVFLERIRSGRPGNWHMEYKDHEIHLLKEAELIQRPLPLIKTG
jgi:protein ImuA